MLHVFIQLYKALKNEKQLQLSFTSSDSEADIDEPKQTQQKAREYIELPSGKQIYTHV